MIEELVENEETSEYPVVSYRWEAEENQMSGYGFNQEDISENFDKYWNSIEQASKSETERLSDAEISLSEIDNAICEIYELVMEASV